MEIGRYTLDTWGYEQMDRYLNQINSAFEEIALQPTIGRDRVLFGQGLRSYSVGEHVVFFRTKKTHIEVIRLLHKRMDFKRHL